MNLISNELTITIVLFEEKKSLVFECLENIKNYKIIIIDNAGNSLLRLKVEDKYTIHKYILNKKIMVRQKLLIKQLIYVIPIHLKYKCRLFY